MFSNGKLERWGCNVKKQDDTLSRLGTIPERDRQTDGRTEFLYQ